eukprot:gene69-81_t
MNPFGNLDEDNDEQIRKFIRFFRQKKDGILRSISSEIDEAKQDRLNEDMFTKEDMTDFSEYISSLVRTQLSQELSDTINMNALIVSKLLENAQSKGVHIDLDIGSAENQALLQAVEKMNLDSIPKRGARRMDALPSMKDEAKATRDEMDRLQTTNQNLQERFNAIQADASKLVKENTTLKNEVDSLNRRLEAQGESSSKAKAESKSDREATQRIIKLEEEVKRAKEEGAKRLSETTQFTQMRSLMKTQNDKIKSLRRKLARYEPDDTKEEDDDEDDLTATWPKIILLLTTPLKAIIIYMLEKIQPHAPSVRS